MYQPSLTENIATYWVHICGWSYSHRSTHTVHIPSALIHLLDLCLKEHTSVSQSGELLGLLMRWRKFFEAIRMSREVLMRRAYIRQLPEDLSCGSEIPHRHAGDFFTSFLSISHISFIWDCDRSCIPVHHELNKILF